MHLQKASMGSSGTHVLTSTGSEQWTRPEVTLTPGDWITTTYDHTAHWAINLPVFLLEMQPENSPYSWYKFWGKVTGLSGHYPQKKIADSSGGTASEYNQVLV